MIRLVSIGDLLESNQNDMESLIKQKYAQKVSMVSKFAEKQANNIILCIRAYG